MNSKGLGESSFVTFIIFCLAVHYINHLTSLSWGISVLIFFGVFFLVVQLRSAFSDLYTISLKGLGKIGNGTKSIYERYLEAAFQKVLRASFCLLCALVLYMILFSEVNKNVGQRNQDYGAWYFFFFVDILSIAILAYLMLMTWSGAEWAFDILLGQRKVKLDSKRVTAFFAVFVLGLGFLVGLYQGEISKYIPGREHIFVASLLLLGLKTLIIWSTGSWIIRFGLASTIVALLVYIVGNAWRWALGSVFGSKEKVLKGGDEESNF